MKKILRISVVLAVVASMVACSSKKKVITTNTNSSEKLVERVLSVQPNFKTASASRARITATYKQREVSANATINIVTDSAIVVSVQPFLGVELIRVEVSKQQVKVVDKLNHRYSSISFAELSSSSHYQISYKDLEAFLTERLFAVGHDTDWLRHARINVTSDDDSEYLSFSEQNLKHSFQVSKATSLINSTTLQLGEQNSLTAKYSGLKMFGDVAFPSVINISAASAPLSIQCSIVLQSLTFNSAVNVTPVNTDKYSKVDISTIIPM